MFKLDSILVPMDFSDHSEHALDYAIGLAKKSGAGIQLLHCYGVEMFSTIAYGPNHVPRIPADFEQEVKKAAGEKLAGYRDKVAAEGIETGCHMSSLFPSEAIGKTAGDLDCSLIVMGTHGLTGLKHILLGSVAERVIRTAPCPVLTLKAPRKAA